MKTFLLLFPLALAAFTAGAKTPAPKTPAKTAPKLAKPAPKPTAKPASKPTAKSTPKATPKPVLKPTPTTAPTLAEPLYQNDLEKLPLGKPPSEYMVLSGEFAVVKDENNTVLELPGEPVDAFGFLFGPSLKVGSMVKARAFGTAKGRRTPAFGVGIFGVSGFKLRVTAAAKQLEILKDEEVKATLPYEWKTGTWTWLRLQARPVEGGKWKVEGRAWPDGSPEPEKWMIEWIESEAPSSGRASILAMPYSGTPLRFDDLLVDKPLP